MPKYQLPQIRLLEAAGFRSFPSTTTRYDGTWAIRMTAGHPAKRLNSVNPLDPDDCIDLENRIALASERFQRFGRPLLFRLTPLAPNALRQLLEASGWESFEESLVMAVDLSRLDLGGVADQLPLKDTGRWVDAYLELSGEKADIKPGLVEIIDATQPETGLFIRIGEDGERVASAVRCAREGPLCGLFDLVTRHDSRRQGHGLAILKTALRWASQAGVGRAWLQVVASNGAARSLYESVGFEEVYRYSYWRPPQSVDGEANTAREGRK